MKKILSFVMAVAIVFSMVPTTAFAAEDTAESPVAEEAAPVEEKAEAPVEGKAEAPDEEKAEASDEEKAEASDEEKAEASDEEKAEAPVEESTKLPAEDTVEGEKNPAAAGAKVPEQNYLINDNDLMTRLRVDYDNQAEFQLGFKVRWDGEQTNRFTARMGMNLLEKGKIRINDGREWTFPEAEMTFTTEDTRSSFHTYNKEFIKDFYEEDTFKITVITPEGYTVELDGVQNKMTQQEREAFKAGMDSESKPHTQYTVDPTYTFLKNQYGTNTLRIDFNEFGSSTAAKTAFCEKAVMKINGQDFGTMKSMGFEVNTYFDFELTDLSVIKDVILEENLNIELTESGSTTSFTIKNELTPEQRQEIAGNSAEPQPETDTVAIGNGQVVLVNSKNHNEESMSGPTMNHEAQFITDDNGDTTVILHFAPAVIMGITAYAKDLSLADCDTQFVLRDDNSGICIVKIPEFTEDEKIIPGHIFSSVMHSDVALKFTKPTQSASLKEALEEKVTEIQAMLDKDNFYESTKAPVLKALEAAKAPQDVIKAYTDLLKAAAGLRKIVEDPFTGDTVFHMEAFDTSTIARNSLGKYVKVEIVDGKKMLTAHYNSYLAFDGLIYMDSVQVLNQEGEEIPSTYTLDENKNGTLTFEMTYVPSSGIYDVVLGDGSKPEYSANKFTETKLCMKYDTIAKGPFKALLKDAIDQYGYYTASDYSGKLPMENRKGDFTESSWSRFEKALNQCKEDLKAGTLTQQQIEESVNNLKDARLGLVYLIKAGSGNTANVGASVLNNPSEPYYSSDPHAEYPEIVGWAGSKVIFGADGAVYRVLDNTLAQNADGKANGGKLLLMAETARVKQPFSPTGDPSVRWNNSALREYMNGEFYQNNFSDVERSAILKTTIETYDYQSAFMGYPQKNPDTRIETEDFIFAPGMDIVTSEHYGYGSNDSRITPAYYALRNVMQDDFDEYVVIGVDPKGRVGGKFVLQSRETEAPACMYLDAGKILMTVNAATGIPEKITAVDALESNLWKLVLQDDALKLNETYQAQVNGNTVAIDMGAYKGQLMAVVIEGNDFASGTVKAYGKVNASGFQLSSFDTAAEKLYVMAVRDEDGKTAYASQPVQVKIDKNIEPSTPDQPEFNKGTVTITMNKDGEQNPSMCDPMFAEKAAVEIHGENAVLKLFVAYPIPGFPNLGTDGTLKNFTISYGGKEYVAKSDITSKPTMTVKADSSGFGLVKGDEITAQVLTVELPKAALNEQLLNAKAYVNVVMNKDVQFDMVLSDKDFGNDQPTPDEGKIADGNYHVNAALWHATSDQASMGDAAFEANRKALVTVKDGKVTTVQMATGSVHMGPIVSAIVEVIVDGQSVEILKTQKLTTEPAGNEIDYIQQFSFQLPDEAQPAVLEGVTYVPVQFKVPDTPMGDKLMSARIKLDWSTAVKTEEGELPQPIVPEKPDSEQIVVDQEDKDTGIKVHADKGVFAEKVELIVKVITEGKTYERAAKALSSVGKKFTLYEIHLENANGEEVQPDGKVTVSYKIPEGYNASKLALYRINDDGTKTMVNGTVKDGYYEVVQKHFSNYALVEVGSKTAASGSGIDKKPSKSKTPKTGDEASVTAYAALLLVASAGIVMVLDKKRKEKN